MENQESHVKGIKMIWGMLRVTKRSILTWKRIIKKKLAVSQFYILT
jgi:hypothetical protein